MENDITDLLKKRAYLLLILFLLIVVCVSFFLLYGMGRSDHIAGGKSVDCSRNTHSGGRSCDAGNAPRHGTKCILG